MVKERVRHKASWKHFCSSEKELADKCRFGPELTEAEINMEDLLILEILTKQSFCSSLLDIGATRLVGYLSLHIQRALVE